MYLAIRQFRWVKRYPSTVVRLEIQYRLYLGITKKMSDVEVNFILIPRDSATKDGINARQKMELALQPLPVHILMLRVSRSALLWHLILPQFKVFFFIYFFLIFFYRVSWNRNIASKTILLLLTKVPLISFLV